MEQTAVEWLIEQINQDYPEITWAYKDECDKAKEMERQQIIEAYDEGEAEWTAIPYKNGNDYYYENFGL
jgi:hypothetical protein